MPIITEKTRMERETYFGKIYRHRKAKIKTKIVNKNEPKKINKLGRKCFTFLEMYIQYLLPYEYTNLQAFLLIF